MFLEIKASQSFKLDRQSYPVYRELGKENIMLNARNSGFITRVIIANKAFEIDGFVKKDIMKSLLSWKALQALDFTDNLGETEPVLSEACGFYNSEDELLEVEIDEIDSQEKRTFDTCLKLAEAIEAFVAKGV